MTTAEVREIVAQAAKEGADPVDWIYDRLREQESRPTRAEVREMVKKATTP